MSFTDGSSVFLLSVTGQVSTGHFPGGHDDLYCKICFVAGPDWAVTAGQEEGISQIARKGGDGGEGPALVWNFPLDITFRSTCPFGWPQVVVSVYELDSFGNEMIRGYGSCHVPLSAGSHSARLPIFRPESSSLLQRMASYFTGRRPEYVDPRVAASGEGRDVTRVTTNGWLEVTFSVITKDLKRMGYESTPRATAQTASSSGARRPGGGGGGGGGEIQNQGPADGIGLVSRRSLAGGRKLQQEQQEEDGGGGGGRSSSKRRSVIEEEEEEEEEGGGGGGGIEAAGAHVVEV